MNNDRGRSTPSKSVTVDFDQSQTAEEKKAEEVLQQQMAELAFRNAEVVHDSCKNIVDFINQKPESGFFQRFKKDKDVGLTKFLIALTDLEIKVNNILRQNHQTDPYARNVLLTEIFDYLYNAPGMLQINKPKFADCDVIFSANAMLNKFLEPVQLAHFEETQSAKVHQHLQLIDNSMLQHVTALTSTLELLHPAVTGISMEESQIHGSSLTNLTTPKVNLDKISRYVTRKNESYVKDAFYISPIPEDFLSKLKDDIKNDRSIEEFATIVFQIASNIIAYNSNLYANTLSRPSADQLSMTRDTLEAIHKLVQNSYHLPNELEKTLTTEIKKNIDRLEKAIDSEMQLESSLTRTTPESERSTPSLIRRSSDSDTK